MNNEVLLEMSLQESIQDLRTVLDAFDTIRKHLPDDDRLNGEERKALMLASIVRRKLRRMDCE